MKYISRNKNMLRRSAVIGFMLFAFGMFNACELQRSFEYDSCYPTAELDMTAWEFISSHDTLELFEQTIFLAGMEGYYQDDSARTFIAPTNMAIEEYLSDNGYGSIEEVPVPILQNLIKYHIVNARVTFTDPDLTPSNNPIAYPTENGQIMYLSHNSNYQGLVNEDTDISWTIATSNLEPTNGIIHVIASVVYFSLDGGSTSHEIDFETDTIFPVYDAYVNAGSNADLNYGTDSLLKVQNVTGDGDTDRKAYLMFDTGEFEKEGDIIEMVLALGVNYTDGNGAGMYLYSVPDVTWTETGLTWNNAPVAEADPIGGITTSDLDAFSFELTDYYLGLPEDGLISMMLDGEAGTDEANEFASKENAELPVPMMVATYSPGAGNLEHVSNTGFSLESGGVKVVNNTVLEITGAASENIIYVLEEAPESGWLFNGTTMLQQGDRFTQMDIDVMNLLYIHNGNSEADQIGLTAMDKDDSYLGLFYVDVTIQ